MARFCTTCILLITLGAELGPHIWIPYVILDIIHTSANLFFITREDPPAANFRAPSIFLHFEIILSLPLSKCVLHKKLLLTFSPRILAEFRGAILLSSLSLAWSNIFYSLLAVSCYCVVTRNNCVLLIFNCRPLLLRNIFNLKVVHPIFDLQYYNHLA